MPKSPISIAVIIVLAVFGAIGTFSKSGVNASTGVIAVDAEYYGRVIINGTIIKVDVASDQLSREKGLSGRGGLPKNSGMLFKFDTDGIYYFWMKNMRFAIDIIWLDFDGRIMHIENDVDPSTYPKTFGTQKTARYVLEVPAGFCKEYKIIAGMRARILI